MAVTESPPRPRRILFHNSYPGLNGSQKMALQLLAGLPTDCFEAWAGSPFATEFLNRCGLPSERQLDFGLPESFRVFRGGLIRQNPLLLGWRVLTQLLPFWWRTKRRLLTERIDLVYVSNERCLFFVGIPARLAGIPVLWHLQSGFRLGRPSLHRLAGRLATRAVAVSEAVREDARLFVPQKLWREMRVIYNGVPERSDAGGVPGGSRLQAATHRGRPPHPNVSRLTYIGALVPEKGLHVLLEALTFLPEDLQKQLIVNIAGVFREEWYREFVGNLVAGLPPGVGVHFLGYCDDVPALLEHTDVLVAPSVETADFSLPDGSQRQVHWKEGFNLVALEGLRAGVPVVASATYGLREVVTDGETGLWCRPGDAADLGEKIGRLAADPALCEQIGRSGRARYERFFTAEKMQAQFHDVFTEMIPRNG